ncbi:hypothetical protein HYC85_026135 [Camellia sinensis]|uniref:J domain-containing protein n=1 Tax=Camellia sinensis TaxID=4442 RepID=A0A7J7G6R5_CAMSI|nr:hypothetical protein HYC85_026135 [Camellia sinensis]
MLSKPVIEPVPPNSSPKLVVSIRLSPSMFSSPSFRIPLAMDPPTNHHQLHQRYRITPITPIPVLGVGFRHLGPSPSASTTSVAYTEEQISIVREIKRKKDYYEILGLAKGCTVDDVRKAYRKLSLKVHPDKNTAPGAEEAFKSVSKAFQCLSDKESRKKYDLVGSDEPVYERRAPRRPGQGFNGLYEADIDAEEIFRNFFGGMHPATSAQFGTFSFGPGMGVRMGNNGSSGWVRTLIQLVPVLLILLFNFMPSSDPMYALYRSYPYEHRLSTQKGVNFYVKSTRFEQDYPPNSPERVRFDGQVEKDYVSVLAHNCQLELRRFQWGLERETPHCDSLKQFEMVT